MTYIINSPLLVGSVSEGACVTKSTGSCLVPVAAHRSLIFNVRLLHLSKPRVLRLFALILRVILLLGCAVSSQWLVIYLPVVTGCERHVRRIVMLLLLLLLLSDSGGVIHWCGLHLRWRIVHTVRLRATPKLVIVL